MKQLRFHYHMDLTFDTTISNHRFTLKCMPKDNDYQQIKELTVDVYPNQFISKSDDSFQNVCLTGYAPLEHDKFYVDVTGLVDTGKQKTTYENKYKVGFYKYHTAVTKPGDALKAYFATFHLEEKKETNALQIGMKDASEQMVTRIDSSYEKAIYMMEKLHSDFIYEKGATDVSTTAEEAFVLGKGVCQDYAHILISLCRMAKIPARYVVGLLEGEGYSHAWVEIFETSFEHKEVGRWIAIDPTNNLIVDDQHIKMSCGRDYLDCMINQGIFSGGGTQYQNISAIVYEYIEKEQDIL
ncbi:MAG: transglutaminase family protein [Eubacteriales bacterium]